MTRDKIREYKKLSFEIKEATKVLEALKEEIYAEAEAEGITEQSWSDISFQIVEKTRTSIDSKALKQEHPSIAEKFCKTSHFRSLLIK